MALLADCHALRVDEIRVPAGRSVAREAFDGTAALIFASGEGRIAIAGCAHAVQAGAVELVCLGEPCTIDAFQDVYAYVVIAKQCNPAYRRG